MFKVKAQKMLRNLLPCKIGQVKWLLGGEGQPPSKDLGQHDFLDQSQPQELGCGITCTTTASVFEIT